MLDLTSPPSLHYRPPSYLCSTRAKQELFSRYDSVPAVMPILSMKGAVRNVAREQRYGNNFDDAGGGGGGEGKDRVRDSQSGNSICQDKAAKLCECSIKSRRWEMRSRAYVLCLGPQALISQNLQHLGALGPANQLEATGFISLAVLTTSRIYVHYTRQYSSYRWAKNYTAYVPRNRRMCTKTEWTLGFLHLQRQPGIFRITCALFTLHA
ncbi:hypothetical protein DFP73DRAFT_113477 [Morchella snyderi]|nr:hypothetical protein DFP73DRAFT_113477 [Morchella snyderi]